MRLLCSSAKMGGYEDWLRLQGNRSCVALRPPRAPLNKESLTEPDPFSKGRGFQHKVAKAQGRKEVSDYAGVGRQKVDVA
jgi:hypothetical protein